MDFMSSLLRRTNDMGSQWLSGLLVMTAALASTSTSRAEAADLGGPKASEVPIVDVLINHNTQERHRIQSLTYTWSFEHHVSNPANEELPTIVKGTEHVTQSGNSRLFFSEQQVQYRGTNDWTARETRGIITDEFTAVWVPGTLNAQRYDHPAVGTPSDEALMAAAMAGQVPLLNFGYGFGSRPLAATRAEFRDPRCWEVEEQRSRDGAATYLLAFRRPGADGTFRTVSRHVIDPSRGFMVTNSSVFDSTGAEIVRRVVQVKQAEPAGVWLPMRIVEVGLQDGKEVRRSSYHVERYQINPRLQPAVFGIESLQLADGTHLIHHDSAGHLSSLVWIDRQLMPLDAYLQLGMAKGKAATAIPNGQPSGVVLRPAPAEGMDSAAPTRTPPAGPIDASQRLAIDAPLAVSRGAFFGAGTWIGVVLGAAAIAIVARLLVRRAPATGKSRRGKP
jgi:hypothetical protein